MVWPILDDAPSEELEKAWRQQLNLAPEDEFKYTLEFKQSKLPEGLQPATLNSLALFHLILSCEDFGVDGRGEYYRPLEKKHAIQKLRLKTKFDVK